MYVRDAKNREEVWLLDRIEELGLDETAFRSRDYVIAIDEDSGAKAGFGRIRIHKTETDEEFCEITSIGVLENWREQGVGAHVVERLVTQAGDQGFEEVYAFVGDPEYLEQFGFERITTGQLPERLAERLDAKREETDPEAVPLVLRVDEFEMPTRFREAFKAADGEEDEEGPIETPEDFGIDPEKATYKYDTGRSS